MLFGRALYMACVVYPPMERINCVLADLSHSSSGTLVLIDTQNEKLEISTMSNATENIVCCGCGILIKERFIYKVMENNYHESCLRCYCCQSPLNSLKKCFARNGNLYCEKDHQELYGKRCQRCTTLLVSTDIVHRVHYIFYHASCFNCYSCHDQLKLGDEYYLIDGEVLCRNDYQILYSYRLDEENIEMHRKTPKRPRTILNAQQRRQFKTAFEKSSKPSRKVREQLANETGLSVRVVQVWFQNQRAKMKKINKKEKDPHDCSKHDLGSEGRSTEDIRSSDDEESISNLESDEIEESAASSFTGPIQKLYNMTASQIYFPYSS